MKLKPIFIVVAIYLLVGTIFASNLVLAQITRSFSSTSSTNYITHQQRPSFQTYYGENVNTYWPILGDPYTCFARQDLMISVAPVGCQPPVVRSDLLAEQNVPVFCQLDAIKINPLIDINQIRHISFSGDYPAGIVGSGFHPARVALRTHDRLLGSPLINNIGYIVLVLKREPDESKLPDSINVTLTADIDYISGNAYGIGRTEFLLEEISDADWERERLRQSFWNGRYFVRLEQADSNFADVSIYEGDRKFTTLRAEKGMPSHIVYAPGMYCRAGLQVHYDGFVSAEKKATIEISSGNDVDVFDVTQSSTFLDNRCRIRTIEFADKTGIGKVTGSCQDKEFVLELKPKNLTADLESVFINGNKYKVDIDGTDYWVDLNTLSDQDRKAYYLLDNDNDLLQAKEEGTIIALDSSDQYDPSIQEKDKTWLKNLRDALLAFKQKNLGLSSTQSNKYNEETMQYFNNAVSSYEEVALDYTNVANGEYGKEALTRATKLAQDFGQDSTKIRLINKYLELYPDSADSTDYLNELNWIQKTDTSSAAEAIQFDDKARTIRLLDISEPKQKSNAVLIVEGKNLPINLRESIEIKHADITKGRIVLDDVNPNEVKLSAYCIENNRTNRREVHFLKLGAANKKICDLDIRLAEANSEKIAKIRITPKAEGTRTQTNFSVSIGIEKRAIKLTPSKTKERIENINKDIKKWERISEKLGKVVTGLKGACFATSALLTFKNFMTGLSGEALARQEVMGGEAGWRNICKDLVANNEYPTLDACYLGKANEIDSDVQARAGAMQKINQQIQAVQSKHIASQGLFGESVNTEEVKKELITQIKNQYGTQTITMGDQKWVERDQEFDSVIVNKLVENPDALTIGDLRALMLNTELQKQSISDSQKANVEARLRGVAERVNNNLIIDAELKRADELTAKGLGSPFYATPENQQTRIANVVRVGNNIKSTYQGFEDLTHTATIIVPAHAQGESGVNTKFKTGTYVLGLKEADAKRGIYTVNKVWLEGGTPINNTEEFLTAYGVGHLKSSSRVSYTNEIAPSSRLCSYYETEPYRGMPAIIPFDYRNGWYAATKQILPVFGGIGAFDASGRVTSFWLCNVGENKKIEFESGLGDDLCQQINLNTGQPLGVFPGLSEQEAQQKITQAVQAIQQAANQHGNKYITVGGERCEVGPPSVGQPGTQCQDFMSPKDCLLLFNVCDPVICPSSRCDFGGQYPVANVAQTGIIGSALLCLPNIREGIIIPVCLTGIQAGIDGFISIMRNHRDCLQESLDTGRMVGICDQIYSIYLCEFFWHQVAPLINVLIPKLIELAYGQGVRGGAEYLTVMSAWQNMENSINYFTQSYAVNSLTAFQTRTVQEVGTEFCKAFISAKAPTAFKTLIEPDSPPQFHAWFDSKTYTTTTLPATAQYKVFYHIFAGKDQGVHFNVYLKSPPESSYYATSPYVQVASGFIPRGEYASETRDFTAPEGYKELCVRINNDEQCGFGQVSTSFAVNYLRDSYVSDQMTNANIRTEAECIGGTHDLRALITPNIQQGVEEVISPEIYRRGIIRICSTQNPGSSTNPLRFVQVGYCDDEKISCWLDKNSVDNALTDSNLLVRNQTLEELEKTAKQYLESTDVFSPDEAEAEVKSLEQALIGLTLQTVKLDKANNILNRITEIFPMLLYNHHKARALLVKAQVFEIVARDLQLKDDQKTRQERPSQPSEDSEQLPSDDQIPDSKRCLLFYPRWKDALNNEITSTTDGTNVILEVQGDENCINQEISFQIFEDDLFSPDDSQVIIGPRTMNTNKIISVEWKAARINDGLFSGNPEFYFIAETNGQSVKSSNLEILKTQDTEKETDIDDETDEQEEEELQFSEKLSIIPTNTGYFIFYRKSLNDPPTSTGLSIIKNTKVISYQTKDNIVARLDRPIESLNLGEVSTITIKPDKLSINISDKLTLSQLNGYKIVRREDNSLIIQE